MTVSLGAFVVDRDQPPLSSEEAKVVDRFHELYYRRWQAGADTINLSWFGHGLAQCPLDLWDYQKFVRIRPDFVVEMKHTKVEMVTLFRIGGALKRRASCGNY